MKKVEGKKHSLIRRLFLMAKPYKRFFILAGLSVICLSFLGPLRPYLIGKMVDKFIIQTQNKEQLLQWSSLIIVILLVEGMLQLISTYFSNLLAQSVIRDIRVKVFQHIANKQENGKTKETPGGLEFVYNLSSNHHAIYSNINMTVDNIKTLKFNDGREVTLVWTLWSANGKFTKEATTVPVHQAFYWSGDKIVSFQMIFDPTPLINEIAATTKK